MLRVSTIIFPVLVYITSGGRSFSSSGRRIDDVTRRAIGDPQRPCKPFERLWGWLRIPFGKDSLSKQEQLKQEDKTRKAIDEWNKFVSEHTADKSKS